MNILENTQIEHMPELVDLYIALSSFEAGEEYTEYSADDLANFEVLGDVVIDENAAALDDSIEVRVAFYRVAFSWDQGFGTQLFDLFADRLAIVAFVADKILPFW